MSQSQASGVNPFILLGVIILVGISVFLFFSSKETAQNEQQNMQSATNQHSPGLAKARGLIEEKLPGTHHNTSKLEIALMGIREATQGDKLNIRLIEAYYH